MIWKRSRGIGGVGRGIIGLGGLLIVDDSGGDGDERDDENERRELEEIVNLEEMRTESVRIVKTREMKWIGYSLCFLWVFFW